MGAFLAVPKIEKNSEHGGSIETLMTHYGAASMQGWRQTMEDAHVALPSLRAAVDAGNTKGEWIRAFRALAEMDVNDVAIYGVFDGHGSNAVSNWTALHFVSVFSDCLVKLRAELDTTCLPKDAVRYGNDVDPGLVSIENAFICQALQQAFLEIDERLLDQETRAALLEIYEAGQKEQEGSKTYLDHFILSNGGDSRVLELAGQRAQKNEDTKKEDKDGSPVIEEVDSEGKQIEASANGPDAATANESHDAKSDKQRINRFNSMPDMDTDTSEGKNADNERGKKTSAVPKKEEKGDSKEDSVEAVKTPLDADESHEESSSEEDQAKPIRAQHPHPSTPEGSGTTSVALVVVGGENPCVITANAGDSRAVFSRKGVAFPLSHDHKPTNPDEKARIAAAGGSVLNGRVDGNLNLSRSLGDMYYKAEKHIPAEGQRITAFPDIRVTRICEEDEFIIIACDGIWDCKTNQEAVDFVRERLWDQPNADSSILSGICEELCNECLSVDPIQSEGHGCDNMTVIIVQLSRKMIKMHKEPNQKIALYGGGEDKFLGSDDTEYDMEDDES